MPRFEPVHLDRPLEDRASMTMLRHYDGCPRSGFLYQQFKGEASTPHMQRGRAGHMAIERSIRAAIDQGETMIPGEVVKVITNEVLAEEHVPIAEHDVLREAVYRWASETAIDPSAVVALETLFALDIDGFQVRCRIDFAQLRENGAVVAVEDFKFARGVPAWEDVARVRPDGSRMGKAMQLLLYAAALAFGVPVREEECVACMGLGDVPDVGEHEVVMNGDPRRLCRHRDGKGRVEIPEPFPIASRAQRFDLAFVYPAVEDREGRMARRSVTLTRLELEEVVDSLRGLVARVRESERTGDWPAMVSDDACSICPAASLCPIPVELRDHRGTINTVEEFAEAMAVLEREAADHRARRTEARNFVKAHGGALPFDRKLAELVYSESEQVTDREGMLAAVERAVEYGEPFDRARFVKVRGRTEFKTRDITPDEIAEEAMASGG